MIIQLLTTIAVMTALLAGWVLVQRLLTYDRKDGKTCDPLKGRWGCAGCILTGHCDREAS